VQTVALPVDKKVIIVDAGHGLPDGGASNGSILESDINLKIALKLQNLLEQSGATVILTRSDENGISELDQDASIRQKHVADLKNRVKIGNESSADIFVSIHLNKIPQPQYTGWQTFFKKDSEISKKLAMSLQNGLNETIQKENKREPTKISGIYIVDNVEIPLSIVECGFLSNEAETNLLNSDEYQNKLAWGIYVGIMNYFMN
jgi:N-acetylmuramoyl-L-alanine amidase